METLDHCLQMGGRHAEAGHIRKLMDCAEICNSAASFMLRGSDEHAKTCAVCAEICIHCAESCERIAGDDATMKKCAEMCRRCATSCERMAAVTAH